MGNSKPFFWLHIKKCGGESFRKTFTPPYVQTDRIHNPKPFIAVPKQEWNDVLNTFKIPLGEYDFRRMLFAKKFLYSAEEFNSMYKFVIVRNPYDRAVSAWKYLMRGDQFNPKYKLMKDSFEYFLSELPHHWNAKYNRHIATHTAPIWNDITDETGNLLVDRIIKLENINTEIELLNDVLNTSIPNFEHTNKNRINNDYINYYNDNSKKLVDELYYDDILNLNYSF